MTYDPTTRRIVLFGGNIVVSGSDIAETWTWDGVTWTQQFPPVSPPARDTAGMTYDEATGNVVLFGGSADQTGQGDVLNDTWVWNGRAKTWTQQFPASSPSPRRANIVYDKASRNVVFFGGDIEQYGCCDVFFGDTWTWNGITWTQQFPALAPSARTENGLAYDPDIRKVVLFGGYFQPGDGLNDTWTWDGTAWAQTQTPFHPGARWDAAMDFDQNSHALVLFSGVLSGFTLVDDTWFFISHR